MAPLIPAAPRLPAVPEYMAIGATTPTDTDLQTRAAEEIARRIAVAHQAAESAGTAQQRNNILQRAPLDFHDYCEAVRNYNAWSVRYRNDPGTRFPNDSPALDAFLSRDLPRNRYTANVAGWRAYLAERHGLLFPEPTPQPCQLNERIRRGHTLVAGGSGSGKSELLKALAHHYVKAPGAAVVVIDPHGKLVRDIARWSEFQAGAAGRLVFIGYDAARGRCPILNPFDVKGLPAYAHDRYAADLALALGSATEQGLSQPMATLLLACIRVLMRHRPDGDPATLRDLHRFLSPDPEQDAADLLAAARRHPDQPVVDYFARDFLATNLRTSKDAVRARLSTLLMASNAFYHMTAGRTTVDLVSAADAGAVVLFDLESMGSTAGDLFGRLIIALLVAHAMRRPDDAENTRTPIHLFVDEAERFFTSYFLRSLEQTRKKALYLTFAQQVAGKGYNGQELESLMINTAIKLQGPGGCPQRMLEQLNITREQYQQHFPEAQLNEQPNGGDFLCRWGARAKTIPLTVTRDIARNAVDAGRFAALLEHQQLKHYEKIPDRAAATVAAADPEQPRPFDPDSDAWQLR